MAQPNVTVWDGLWIRSMESSAAIVARDAGLVQIFDGPRGYDPGFMMAYPQDFPLVAPTPTAPELEAKPKTKPKPKPKKPK